MRHGETRIASQSDLAAFVCADIPVIGQVQAFVLKAFSAGGYGEQPRSRSAHGICLFDKDAGRTRSVTQMHGLRDLRGKGNTAKRAARARRRLEISQAVTESGGRAVICGDFNVGPDSKTLCRLQSSGLVELVTMAGQEGTRTSCYYKSGRLRGLYADQ